MFAATTLSMYQMESRMQSRRQKLSGAQIVYAGVRLVRLLQPKD